MAVVLFRVLTTLLITVLADTVPETDVTPVTDTLPRALLPAGNGLFGDKPTDNDVSLELTGVFDALIEPRFVPAESINLTDPIVEDPDGMDGKVVIDPTFHTPDCTALTLSELLFKDHVLPDDHEPD